jgi:predicted ferric reductase
MSSQIWWYVARSGGIVGWVLLSASVIWGLLLSTKVLGRKPRPAWLLDLHRFLGGLAVVFTVIHVGAIVADSYVHFGVVDILVPFASSWRPTAVAWGVVGLYLLAAVELTSLLRKHMSKRAWHATHLLSLPLFLVATLHGLTAGTDSTSPVLRYSMVGVTIGVLGLLLLRAIQALLPSASTHSTPARPRIPTSVGRGA